MNATPRLSPWWDRDRHDDRRSFLRARSEIISAVRRLFGKWGFVEVETGILQVSPGNETHLHALRADIHMGGEVIPRYLRTSPEFSCKKLLAAGEDRIVEFARVFRDHEDSPLHLNEFTMLEWYRANAPYSNVIDDCVAVIGCAAQAANIRKFSFRGKAVDPFLEPLRMTVAEAFETYTGLDLLSTIDRGESDRAMLASLSRDIVRVADDDTWSDIFSKILTEHIEPKLGEERMTVLYEYPAPEAALARAKPDDPRVAERFEVYACGVELANGFGELTDAEEQRRRFASAMDEKERRYGERYPIDTDFIAAVAQMPDACGVALGFDRLVMLASGATRLDQVVWAPVAQS
ncbi:MAG: EF-P lysine aminoacylase GenX [Xanthobacteraceae bacterium]|nr:EF-P lysine aminoacylase GenX [Xanthobacteraceae bacterium]